MSTLTSLCPVCHDRPARPVARVCLRCTAYARRYGRERPADLGPGDGRRKLSGADVARLRAEFAGGRSLADLAARWGVARATVYDAVTGRSWKFAGGPVFGGTTIAARATMGRPQRRRGSA